MDKHDNTTKIKQIVQSAIQEMNEELEVSDQIMYTEESVLFGKGEGIDSFSFVSLISNIEDQLLEVFDKEILLINDTVLTGKESPFATIGALVNYIERLVEDAFR